MRDWYTCRVQIHIIIIIIIFKHHLYLADINTSGIIFSSLHASFEKKINMEKLDDISFSSSCYFIIKYIIIIIAGLHASCCQSLCCGLYKLFTKPRAASCSSIFLFKDDLFHCNGTNYGFVRCNSLINGFSGPY